jgi:hypothetical protein
MNNKIKTITLLLLLSFTIVIKSQTAIFKLSGTTNQTAVVSCSYNEILNFDLNLGAAINGSNGEQYIGVEIYKVNTGGGAPTKIHFFNMGAVGIPLFPSSFNGNFQVKFTNSSIQVLAMGLNPSVSYTRSSGNYFAKIIVDNNTNPNLNFTRQSSNIFIQVGINPQFTINNSSPFGGGGAVNHLTLLSGCDNGEVILRLKSDQTCAVDGFKIMMVEKDIDGNYIGNTYNRPLTQSEIDNIKGANAPGISIKTINSNVTNGSNNGSITITAGKWYDIFLVYCPGNIWLLSKTSLHYKSGNWDLVIKDNTLNQFNFKQLGYEPGDKWNNDLFKSPDLINKLSNSLFPASTTHENPDFVTNAGNTNKLITTVTNIGCAASPANVPLRLFWTRARTEELYNKHWVYDMTNNTVQSAVNNSFVTAGSEITILNPTINNPYNANSSPFLLPSIAPLTVYKTPFANGVNWFPPNPVDYDATNGSMSNNNAHPVICLLARINEKNSASDPILWEPTGINDRINPYVKYCNNVATRNSWLVNEPSFLIKPNGNNGGGFNYGFGTVLVNNPGLTPKTVNICVDLMPDVLVLNNFNNFGTINIGVTNGLYNQWLLGGQVSENLTVSSPTLFTMTSGTRACLNNVTLPVGFNEQIGLRFNFNSTLLPASPIELNYQLSQYSILEGDTLYGSNTVYVVNIPNSEPELPNSPNEQKLDNNPIDLELDKIILYPNPSYDHVSISFNNNNNQDVVIEVYDSKGAKVYQNSSNKSGVGIEKISTKDFSNGIYTVMVKTANQTFVEKLTIIR